MMLQETQRRCYKQIKHSKICLWDQLRRDYKNHVIQEHGQCSRQFTIIIYYFKVLVTEKLDMIVDRLKDSLHALSDLIIYHV